MINLSRYLADEQIRLHAIECGNNFKKVSIGFGERVKGLIAAAISSLASCFSPENKWSHIAAEAYAQFWEGRRFVAMNSNKSESAVDREIVHTSHRVADVASPKFTTLSPADTCSQIKNGIRNPGNACYAISIIEVIRFNPSLKELVTRPLPRFRFAGMCSCPVDEQAWNIRNEFKQALSNILESLDKGETIGSELIKGFFEKVRALKGIEPWIDFDWQNPHDAQKFFKFLIDVLYLGTDINEKGEAVRSEKILIKERPYQYKGCSGVARNQTDVYNIYLPSKEIDGKRKVACDSFRDALTADLKILNQTLGNAPPILMFPIGRSFSDETYNNRMKITGGIEISQKFDIAEFLTEGKKVDSTQYELSSIIEHRGSIDGGHYVMYQCLENGEWICCNDSNVTIMPNFNPKNIEAFFIFYRKVQI